MVINYLYLYKYLHIIYNIYIYSLFIDTNYYQLKIYVHAFSWIKSTDIHVCRSLLTDYIESRSLSLYIYICESKHVQPDIYITLICCLPSIDSHFSTLDINNQWFICCRSKLLTFYWLQFKETVPLFSLFPAMTTTFSHMDDSLVLFDGLLSLSIPFGQE